MYQLLSFFFPFLKKKYCNSTCPRYSWPHLENVGLAPLIQKYIYILYIIYFSLYPSSPDRFFCSPWVSFLHFYFILSFFFLQATNAAVFYDCLGLFSFFFFFTWFSVVNGGQRSIKFELLNKKPTIVLHPLLFFFFSPNCLFFLSTGWLASNAA